MISQLQRLDLLFNYEGSDNHEKSAKLPVKGMRLDEGMYFLGQLVLGLASNECGNTVL